MLFWVRKSLVNTSNQVSEIKKLLLLLHFLHSSNTNIYVVSGPQSLALSHPDQHRSQLNSFFLGLTVLHPIYKQASYKASYRPATRPAKIKRILQNPLPVKSNCLFFFLLLFFFLTLGSNNIKDFLKVSKDSHSFQHNTRNMNKRLKLPDSVFHQQPSAFLVFLRVTEEPSSLLYILLLWQKEISFLFLSSSIILSLLQASEGSVSFLFMNL